MIVRFHGFVCALDVGALDVGAFFFFNPKALSVRHRSLSASSALSGRQGAAYASRVSRDLACKSESPLFSFF